ncbi:unnamed protein product [Oppiella nova]|uniref:OTU domain-containing protein n=1 Tax=Oppiella nova TaxID=334625 RepID=A0A7R9M252_9ACAR|nr:unnamed protein product [Oppiella nova]CAG2168619.1 unnamed protein product [Oppiella nova]
MNNININDKAYGVTDNRKYAQGKTYTDTVNVRAVRERVDRDDRERYEQALQVAKREKANERHGPESDYNIGNDQGTYDLQLEQTLQLSKMQSEWDNKRRLETERETKNKLIETAKAELQEKLYRIFCTELYTPEKLMAIKKSLGEYETTTGSTIFDTCQISDLQHKDLNDTSRLVLYVAKVTEYSVNKIPWNNLFEFFGDHIRRIERELTTKTTLVKYNTDVHSPDLESQFVHDALEGELVCVHIRGDGNCLWNSISTALYGDYSRMESLRVITATTLIKHQDVFEKYMHDQRVKYGYNHELSFDGLVRAAMDLQVWGDELHVMALSLALHRPIYSYWSLRLAFDTKSPKQYPELKDAYERQTIQNHFRYIADEANVGAKPILLYYNGRDHYSVVLPVRDDVVALVPQMQLLKPIFKREVDEQDLIILDQPVDDKNYPDKSINQTVVKIHESSQNSSPKLNEQVKTTEPKSNSVAGNQGKLIDKLKCEHDKQITELTHKLSQLNAHITSVNNENIRLIEHVSLLNKRCIDLNKEKLTWYNERDTYRDRIKKLFNDVGILEFQLKSCEQAIKPNFINNGNHANDLPINGRGINNHNNDITKSLSPDNIGWKYGIENMGNGSSSPHSLINPPPGMSTQIYQDNNNIYPKQFDTENDPNTMIDKVPSTEPMQTDL